VTDGRVNTDFNPEIGRFEIPEEKVMPRRRWRAENDLEDDEYNSEDDDEWKDNDSEIDDGSFAQI